MKKSRLDILWDVASKWYSFPLIYIILSFIVFMYLKGYSDIEPAKILLLTIYLIPNGVFYFNYLYTGNTISIVFANFFPPVYFIFVFIVIILIQLLRKYKIYKFLILLLLILFMLTFFGCAAGQWQNTIYFEPVSLFG